MAIPAPLRREVIERARHRCEYCGLAQAGQEAAFHIDHVRPVNANGETRAENLALACVSCSLRKGDRESAVDPESGGETELFNPRRDLWSEHFRWNGVEVIGRTTMGRAMVAALRMNRPLALAIRSEEIFRQRHPPP